MNCRINPYAQEAECLYPLLTKGPIIEKAQQYEESEKWKQKRNKEASPVDWNGKIDGQQAHKNKER